jgi:hypothetical protein
VDAASHTFCNAGFPANIIPPEMSPVPKLMNPALEHQVGTSVVFS